MKRFDERDIMFARMSYEKGSPQYEDYYKRNPEKKITDDNLREMPDLMGEGTATFDPLNSPIGVATFKFLADIKGLAEGDVNSQKTPTKPHEITNKLKGLAKFYGADLVGITEIKKDFYYSYRGRDPHYGEKIDHFYKYAIAFAVEMDRDMINRAPTTPEAIEVTKGYTKAAIIGMILSYYIRELGSEARNHMDGNYLVIAPLVAEAAGLGEIGRMGLLVTKKFGPRVRLGVVTTELELIPDGENKFGLKEFCEICKKCAKFCPARAISNETIKNKSGFPWENIDHEKCYQIWRKVGTDCGICLAACPFSHELDEELVETMQYQKENIKQILKLYEEKYKRRPYNQNPHGWL